MMAHDDDVWRHRLEVANGIDECLALDDGASRDADIDAVRREALGRDLERDARARARFVEKVDDRAAPQGRNFLDRPGTDFFEGFGRRQEELDLLCAEGLDAQEVFAAKRHPVSTTSSRPSCSATWTCTVWVFVVSRVAPV